MPNGKEIEELLEAGFGDPAKYRAGLDLFHEARGHTIRPIPKELDSLLDVVFGDKETGKGGDMTVTINM